MGSLSCRLREVRVVPGVRPPSRGAAEACEAGLRGVRVANRRSGSCEPSDLAAAAPELEVSEKCLGSAGPADGGGGGGGGGDTSGEGTGSYRRRLVIFL